LGPFLSMICINGLPQTTNSLSVPIIFADNSSVIICSNNFVDFCILSNRALSHMRKCFTAKKLALNLDKTNIIKSITNNSQQYPVPTLDKMIIV
jgi:hypothetical protein